MLTEKGVHKKIDRLVDLPAGPVWIIETSLQDCKGVRDADLIRFQGLKDLVSLNLGGTSVSGSGLIHLRDLPRLRELWLAGLQLSAVRSWPELPSVEGLILSSSRFEDESLAGIEALRNLKRLELGWTDVGNLGLKHLHGLKQLNYVSLDATKVTDDGLTSLTVLKSLNQLKLSRTISPMGLSALKGLPNLKVLMLDTPTIDATVLNQIPSLTNLMLTGLADDAARTRLGEMPGIQQLDIRQVQGDLKDWRFLGSMKELEVLVVGSCSLPDEALAHFPLAPGLRRLSLISVPVTDVGAAHLHKLTNLTVLNVTKNQISADGVNKLRTALPRCTITSDHGRFAPTQRVDRDRAAAEWIVSVGGSFIDTRRQSVAKVEHIFPGPSQITKCNLVGIGRVKDDDLAYFKGLESLAELLLDNSGITEMGLAHLSSAKRLSSLQFRNCRVKSLATLKNCPNLTQLVLSGNPINDEGLATVKEFPKLEILALGGTRIADAGLRHVKGLAQLTYLELNATEVTDAGLEQIATLTKLTQLHVTGCKLSAEGVMKLASKLPGCRIVSDHGTFGPK